MHASDRNSFCDSSSVFIDPALRSKALLRVGIQGERYTRLKPKVDAAQAAAQREARVEPPAPPREILVAAGRPDERRIRLVDDDLEMEPAP